MASNSVPRSLPKTLLRKWHGHSLLEEGMRWSRLTPAAQVAQHKGIRKVTTKRKGGAVTKQDVCMGDVVVGGTCKGRASDDVGNVSKRGMNCCPCEIDF